MTQVTSSGSESKRRISKSEIAGPKGRALETPPDLPAPRPAPALEPASQLTRIVYLAALLTALLPTALSGGLERVGQLLFEFTRLSAFEQATQGHQR